MHYHSSFLSVVMCKCSYIVTERDSKHRPDLTACSIPHHHQDSNTGNTNTSRVSYLSSTRGRGVGESRTTALNSSSKNVFASRRSSGTSPRISLVKRSKLRRRVTISSGSNQSVSSVSGDKVGDETDWPPFADEDYIVFCFEEDGAFHVVMEESPKPPENQYDQEGETTLPDQPAACACSLDKKASYHFQPHHNRRDCLLANKEVDEERFLFSPRFDFPEDGKGRDRIMDGIPELDFDEIKTRDQKSQDEFLQELEFDEIKSLDQFEAEEEVERRNSSMECCNGSIGSSSSSSSQSDWEHHHPHYESHDSSSNQEQRLTCLDTDQESRESCNQGSPPPIYSRKQGEAYINQMITSRFLPAGPEVGEKIPEEEQIMIHSSRSQSQGRKGEPIDNVIVEEGETESSKSSEARGENLEDEAQVLPDEDPSPKSQDRNKDDDDDHVSEEKQEEDDSEVESSESSEPSQSDTGDGIFVVEAEVESTKSRDSNQSDSSNSSFAFPVPQWDWIGSPETWPRTRSLHFRKHKHRPVCLPCCSKF